MFKFISFLFFLFLYLSSLAQFTHEGRGMYVDKFFRLSIDQAGLEIVDPNFSILSIQSKEDSLLKYAKNNHITYLALYDLYWVLGNPVYEGYLCDFIEKAKTKYCIEKIGVPSSCASMFNNIYELAATPPINMNSRNANTKKDSSSEFMRLIQNVYPPGDSLFYISEALKLNLRAASFNDSCEFKVDVLVTEFEFWREGIDDCLEIYQTMAQKYSNYQSMINWMDSIRDNYNSSHADHQIYVESYLGYLDTSIVSPYISNTYHQLIANWIDGLRNGKRRVDRINTHYYGANPVTLYGRSNGGQADTGYYLYRFLDFCQPGTNNKTNLHPIFSAENILLRAENNFLGNWFGKSINNNIFRAEKIWYDDWCTDAHKFHQSTVGHANLGNVITPGGVQWFTSSFMTEPLKNPVLFTSNSPVCVGPGGTGTLKFEYQGPIEEGNMFRFYITSTNSSGIVCGSSGFVDWPSYDTVTQTSINLNSLIGTCALGIGDYDAHLDLIYSSGCDTFFVPPLRVSVVTTGKIVALTPTTVCSGTPVYLQASSTGSGGSTTYAWSYIAGQVVGTNSTYAPNQSLTGTTIYSCVINSSINSCDKSPSNTIPVTFNSIPPATVSIQNYNGCAVTLNALPAGGTYRWHNGSTSSTYTTSWGGNYSVAVTMNGCTGTFKKSYTRTQISYLNNSRNCTAIPSGSIEVNISDGLPPYSLSWSGPVNGNISSLPDGEKIISNLLTGTYTITATDSRGCSHTLIPNPVVDSCPPALNMKMYIQGFYSGDGLMEAAPGKGCLHHLDPVAYPDPSDVDYVTVTAMNSSTYLPVESQTGRLKTNGTLNLIFTGSAKIGHSYYLRVTHRNLIETWSKNLVLFTLNTTYDFTTASTMAYDDGVSLPMIQLLLPPIPERWAMFNGDIDQDGAVTSLDMTEEENASVLGLFGYYPTDLDGDGGSTSLDMTIIENNALIGVFVIHP